VTQIIKEGEVLTVFEVSVKAHKPTISRVTGTVGLVNEHRCEVHLPRRQRQLFVSLSPSRPVHHYANAFLTFAEARREAVRLLHCDEHNLREDLKTVHESLEALATMKDLA
jgi:hypothetical protein